jgi:hypothetical protein
MCRIRYYPRFYITSVGLWTYYARMRGHYCTYVDTKRVLRGNGSDYLQQFETVTHSPVLRACRTVRYEEGLTSLWGWYSYIICVIVQNCHPKQGVVDSGSQFSVIYHTCTHCHAMRGPSDCQKISNFAAATWDETATLPFLAWQTEACSAVMCYCALYCDLMINDIKWTIQT